MYFPPNVGYQATRISTVSAACIFRSVGVAVCAQAWSMFWTPNANAFWIKVVNWRDPNSSFALAELYIVIACVFRRFDLELYDTIRERDVDVVRDYFIGEVSPETCGIRVKACKWIWLG